MKLGIDFGTTNTAVSVLKGCEPEPMSFGHDGQEKYVPSVMAFKSGFRDREYIGLQAKEHIGEPGADVYQNFKMLLGEHKDVVKKHWGNKRRNPEDITRLYIAGLLTKIKDEHHIQPTRVVVTVPEIWQAQNLQTKREHLISSFKEQGVSQVKIESEPVAAATYFVHCFNKQKPKVFNGHLLVCDCGGGTMDFCLARVEPGEAGKPRITILERAGNGMVNGSIGSAGVAYDQAVVDALFPNLRNADIEKYHRTVREFERSKITKEADITEIMELYRSSPLTVTDEVLFSLHDMSVPVYSEHLASVFDEVIAPGIRSAMKDILTRISDHREAPVNIANAAEFRVLMVGGFSSFYLVRESIKDAFGSRASSDLRFEEILTLQDRSFAIAMGAALIANDLAEIIHTCPLDIGITAHGWNGFEHNAVLKKGKMVDDYKNICWARNSIKDEEFLITNSSANIPVFLSPRQGVVIPVDISGASLGSILPDGNGGEQYVNIGFSMDENMVVSIHVRNTRNNKKLKTTTLGNLMAKLPPLIVNKE